MSYASSRLEPQPWRRMTQSARETHRPQRRAALPTRSLIVYGALAVLNLSACSRSDSSDSRSSESDTCDCEASCRELDRSLNPGYVLLYQTMDAFSGMDKVLLIKRESDPFEEVLESVADYAGTLADQLKELDERDDAIDLAGQSMPRVIGNARKAMGGEVRETVGGPFKGATGSELERSLLLALDQGMSESRYVVRELARSESSEERHALLEDADRRLGELVRAVRRQLEARHFCDKAGIDED